MGVITQTNSRWRLTTMPSVYCSIMICLLLICHIVNANHTDFWHDEFDDPGLIGWEFLGVNTAFGVTTQWEAEDGFLSVHAPREASDILRFVAWTPPYSQATIAITDLQRNGASEGISIVVGKLATLQQRDFRGSLLYACYIASESRVFPRVLTGNAFGNEFSFLDFVGWPSQPAEGWHVDPVNALKVDFDQGHFQVSVNGTLMHEFADPYFGPADLIGLYYLSHERFPTDGRIGSFSISGTWSVSPREKLGLTWGSLKSALQKQRYD